MPDRYKQYLGVQSSVNNRAENLLFRSPVCHQDPFLTPLDVDLDLRATSAQAIHDDLVATLGDEALALSTVTKHVRKAQSNVVKVLSTPIQVHLTSMTPTRLFWSPFRKSLFRQHTSFREPSQALPFTED
jgi:hypothetical protein